MNHACVLSNFGWNLRTCVLSQSYNGKTWVAWTTWVWKPVWNTGIEHLVFLNVFLLIFVPSHLSGLCICPETYWTSSYLSPLHSRLLSAWSLTSILTGDLSCSANSRRFQQDIPGQARQRSLQAGDVCSTPKQTGEIRTSTLLHVPPKYRAKPYNTRSHTHRETTHTCAHTQT